VSAASLALVCYLHVAACDEAFWVDVPCSCLYQYQTVLNIETEKGRNQWAHFTHKTLNMALNMSKTMFTTSWTGKRIAYMLSDDDNFKYER
jgi:hypothetical protein